MTEQEFLNIRNVLFSDIFKSNNEKADLERQIQLLKNYQKKKLDDYDKMEQVKDIDERRSLVLEEFNLSIIQKQALIKKEEASIERAQVYFKYIIALHGNNEADMKKYKEDYIEIIKKQALEECNSSINLLKQKRIAATKFNSYSEKNPSSRKQEEPKPISKEELDYDRVVQFELEENVKLMKEAFEKEKPNLSDSFMRSKSAWNGSPVNCVKNVYPNLKDQMIIKEQNSIKGNK